MGLYGSFKHMAPIKLLTKSYLTFKVWLMVIHLHGLHQASSNSAVDLLTSVWPNIFNVFVIPFRFTYV